MQQPYGYRLVGNAHNSPTDYIPSLIGVAVSQSAPSVGDVYFEAYDLPPVALELQRVQATKWVSYDSLPASARDPIVAVKTADHVFYHTLSELTSLLMAAGRSESLALLDKLLTGPTND